MTNLQGRNAAEADMTVPPSPASPIAARPAPDHDPGQPADARGRPRRGRMRLGAWIARLAGSFSLLSASRAVLPGFFAILLLAGWASEATAQTVTPNFVCQGQTQDIVVTSSDWPSSGTASVRNTAGAGTVNRGTNWKVLGSDGTEITPQQFSAAISNGSITLRIQNISADGNYTFEDSNFYVSFRINFYASTHASCAATDGVTVTPTTLALTELGSSGAVEKTYTVKFDTDPTATATVTITNGDSSAVSVDTNTTMAGLQNTLTFTAGGDGSGTTGNGNWAVAQTVTVRALNDGDAANESFNLTHAITGATAAYRNITPAPVAVTTTDAGHGVIVSKSSLTVAENDATETYTLRLKSQPGGTVAVTPTSSMTSKATVSGAVSWMDSDWSTGKTVTVTGKDDGASTVSHMVTTATTDYPTTTTIPSVAVTVTAVANTGPAKPGGLSAAAGDREVALSWTDPGNAAITAWQVRVKAGSGNYGAWTPIPASTATTTTHTVTGLANGTEHAFQVRAMAGAAAGAVSDEVTATPVPKLKVEVPNVTEGETGTIKLTLSAVSSQSISISASGVTLVSCALVGGCPQGTTIADSAEYSAIPATITFAPGQTVKTFTFTAVDDSASEATEVFLFSLSGLSASEATIDSSTPKDLDNVGNPAWFVRIHDNDDASNPNVTIEPVRETVDEGTAAQFALTATPAPSSALTVTVTVSEETGGGQDFVAAGDETAHTVTIPTVSGKATFSVPTTDDDTQEADGAVTAVLSGSGFTAGPPSRATVTVRDNDDATMPTVSVRLPSQEGVSRDAAGRQPRDEDDGATGVSFPVSASTAVTGTLNVCVRVTETGGDPLANGRVAAVDEGIKQVALTSSGNLKGTGMHGVTWTDSATDDQDSTVKVEVLAPGTSGCAPTTGTYKVSASRASDSIVIQDDEKTEVSLTASDTAMTEGDATDTAMLTVSLGRQLKAGEEIAFDILLATTTGARLPGSDDGNSPAVANHDFEVTATGTGVAIADALTASPMLTFTGDDTNTVQTATVTLTPVANRDDGDTADETVTASLPVALNTFLESGGAEPHATDNAATLTIEDDEGTPAATPGITLSTGSDPLRLLETGTATYTVVLDAAPTASVTVQLSRVGPFSGAANVSPTSLTFNPSGSGLWSTPQTVTVTGVDEAGTHRNRNMPLVHAASSSDSRYNVLNKTLTVNVDDAPEVEAWEAPIGRNFRWWARPETIRSRPGFSHFYNEIAPATSMHYKLRLSNRPATGETVTVTATSSDFSRFGLALTANGTPQASLTLTFEDRDPNPGCHNSWYFVHAGMFSNDERTSTPANGQVGEDMSGRADTSWMCRRWIWVVNMQPDLNTNTRGCADITHTATGGGVRAKTIETIRAHTISHDMNTTDCPRLSPGGWTPLPTQMDETPAAGSAPTEAVANLAVTAESGTQASASWDAVERATSYEVAWQAENSDGSTVFTGDESVTGTSATILHGAEEPMTLTVIVTPEYIDGNGDKQRVDTLAATARLAVGPGAVRAAAADGAQALEAAVANGSVTVAVPASWTGRGRPQVTGGAHRLAGWSGLGFDFRGLGDPPGTVTVSWSSRPAGDVKLPLEWQPVAGADWRHSDGEPIGKFEVAIADPAPQPQPQPQAAPAPEVTISGGDGVTEGTAASFTLTADAAPADELSVKVTIAQTGAVADASELGERTVTIPVGETEATFTLATLADGTDEPAGALTATVSDGDGYTVGGTGASATVAVEDDDETTVALSAPAGDLREAKAGAKTLTLTLGRALVEGERLAVPLTFAGTATLGSDYTLAAPKTAPKGVTWANLASTDPKAPPTVTFAGPAGGASAISATLVLTAVADSAAEGERETVTVEPGTLVATGLGGGASASGTASFAILEPPPEISIAAKTASVTEGADAAFTLTASRAPGADLTVKLTVSEAAGPGSGSGASSDFVAASSEGAATATIPKGKTEAVFSVPTVDDAQDEPDGTVTATLGPDGKDGLRYTVAAAPKDAAQVKVADNDAAATGPTFSVGDETVDEKDGLMFFTVQLSTAQDWPVSVRLRTRESSPVSAESGRDYLPMDRTLYFNSGQTEVRTWVYVFNDNHDEDPETFEVALSDARDPGGAVGIGDGVAVGTIVNSDPMPAAWLARFGRTAAEQALDGIAARMAAPRTAGVQGAIAGQALNFDPGKSSGSGNGGNGSDGSGGPGGSANGNSVMGNASGSLSMAQSDIARAFGAGNGGYGSGFGHDGLGFGTGAGGPQSRSMTAREAMLGSSFTATGEEDSSGGSLALWGRAAQSHFDGREGAFSLDGEATAAMLGADYARDKWMVGLALMQTGGKGGYRDTEPRSGAASRALSQLCADNDDDADREDRQVLCSGAVREGDGKVEASLAAAIPYGAWQASERLKLWGAAGYGTGEVTLKPEMGGSYKADIAWTMAALGARGDVIAPPREGSGPALAVTSDALWARTSSDKTHDLAASESDVTRLRLGLEGSYRIALEEGGTVTPKLEVGARHDGGDAETGFGVELGGGLAWNDPALGLTLDLSGRTLIAHGNDDLKDRGYSASLAWDPDPATKRGPSFSLTQDWGGQAKGGLDALFQTAPLADRAGGGEPTARWQAEAAYGFPVFGDRFTGSPHVGLGLATGSRDYSLGWRLTPTVRSPDLSFGLKATRRENDGTVPEHTVGFEAVARW